MKAILTYHSVDESGSVISIDEPTFRRHVRWLASGRVQVLPLDRLLDAPADVDAVAITFDDGLESFGRVAAPLLHDHGLPVTLFVVADAVGTSRRRDPGAPAARLGGARSARGARCVGRCSHLHASRPVHAAP
jgi:hypothetical protein